MDWVKGWVATLQDLQAYVKKFYTTGLTWNPKGVEAAVKAAGAAGAPPPPPPCPGPPPPPPAGSLDLTAPDPTKNARADLLAALSKGSDVTKGLKKVTDDQKTHKNPALKSSGVVLMKEKSQPAKTFGKPVIADKPPKLELDGKKWNVEFFKNKADLEISNVEVNQSVYVYKCEGSTIKVNGKCNNIIIDGCKKTAVVFGSVVSSIEFINCQSVQMQVSQSVLFEINLLKLIFAVISGPGEGSHHLCGEDRRLPDVPQRGVRAGGDRDGQVERDECDDPEGRGLCGDGDTRAVQDSHTGRQAGHQCHGVRLDFN